MSDKDKRAADIFDHAVQRAPWHEELVEMINRDIKTEGKGEDGDIDVPATEAERLIGAVVALCNVTAIGADVAARGVAALERIATALERAHPARAAKVRR